MPWKLATRFTFAVLFFALSGVSRAGESQPNQDDEKERIAWLKKHLAPIRTIDPHDEDFADLEPLKKAIGDARIVFLSEELHGVGATFQSRTRVIKYLHQKCGFDVLAFESGLYDCKKAWEFLREGKMPARDAAGQGIFGIWTGTEELQPMFTYLGKQAKRPKPLEVCGFDCQFSGPASRVFLPDDLAAMLKKLPADALAADERATVVQAFKKLARPGTGVDKREAEALAACQKALADAKASDVLPAGELAYWRQFLVSSIAMVEVESAHKSGVKTERNHINLRDTQMADNLVWLAREAYPKRKIMVWAAAFHLMRNPRSVAMVIDPGKTPDERKTVHGYAQGKITTMGHEAWKKIEKESYSIFFTAAEGEFQNLSETKPQKIAPLIPGSLEDLIIKAGGKNAFFNMRERGDAKWLEERLVARFLGDMDHEADWTKVCDGVVFTRKQFGVTPAKIDMSAVKYQPERKADKLGVPFDCYTTRDEYGRTITFYLSQPPKDSAGKLPVAVFIQGAGCASVFSERDGKVAAGLQRLLLEAAKGKFRVLVVERPGVKFGAAPKNPDTAEEGSVEFRQEHTLPRWVEAVSAAVRATHRLEDIDWRRTLAVGYGEGGITAAHLAAANPLVSHVALLAAGGPTQLFDLSQSASEPRPDDRSPADAKARVEEIERAWAKVLADPDSADKLWLGQPHRRWSSFLKTSTIEGLHNSHACVFAVHGSADKVSPIAGFDLLRAELVARGRDLVAERLEGRDHALRKTGEAATDVTGMQEACQRIAGWFEKKESRVELAIKKETDRMQGTWQLKSINQSGDSEPLKGVVANMQLIVKGDRRTVQAGKTVYTQAYYSIDPHAQPQAIDVVVTGGSMRGQTLLGIYSIEGDRMRICLASAGRDRPRDFNPKAGSGHTMQELERVSP